MHTTSVHAPISEEDDGESHPEGHLRHLEA